MTSILYTKYKRMATIILPVALLITATGTIQLAVIWNQTISAYTNIRGRETMTKKIIDDSSNHLTGCSVVFFLIGR